MNKINNINHDIKAELLSCFVIFSVIFSVIFPSTSVAADFENITLGDIADINREQFLIDNQLLKLPPLPSFNHSSYDDEVDTITLQTLLKGSDGYRAQIILNDRWYDTKANQTVAQNWKVESISHDTITLRCITQCATEKLTASF